MKRPNEVERMSAYSSSSSTVSFLDGLFSSSSSMCSAVDDSSSTNERSEHMVAKYRVPSNHPHQMRQLSTKSLIPENITFIRSQWPEQSMSALKLQCGNTGVVSNSESHHSLADVFQNQMSGARKNSASYNNSYSQDFLSMAQQVNTVFDDPIDPDRAARRSGTRRPDHNTTKELPCDNLQTIHYFKEKIHEDMTRELSRSTTISSSQQDVVRAQQYLLNACQQLIQPDGHGFKVFAQKHDELSICVPRSQDVLLGRGRSVLLHPGNIRLRSLVDKYRRDYENQKTTTRDGKTALTKMIVDMVKSSGEDETPGRFLKYHQGLHGWVEINDELARKKISHLFRDKPRKNMMNKGNA